MWSEAEIKNAMYENGTLSKDIYLLWIEYNVSKAIWFNNNLQGLCISQIHSQFQVIIIKLPILQNKNYWQSAKAIISLNAQKDRPFELQKICLLFKAGLKRRLTSSKWVMIFVS